MANNNMASYDIKIGSFDPTLLVSNIAGFRVVFEASDGTLSDEQYFEVHSVLGEGDEKIASDLVKTADAWELTFITPDYLTYSE